jgi:hypothetical protein
MSVRRDTKIAILLHHICAIAHRYSVIVAWLIGPALVSSRSGTQIANSSSMSQERAATENSSSLCGLEFPNGQRFLSAIQSRNASTAGNKSMIESNNLCIVFS